MTNDTTGSRTRDLPPCSTVHHRVPPRDVIRYKAHTRTTAHQLYRISPKSDNNAHKYGTVRPSCGVSSQNSKSPNFSFLREASIKNFLQQSGEKCRKYGQQYEFPPPSKLWSFTVWIFMELTNTRRHYEQICCT